MAVSTAIGAFSLAGPARAACQISKMADLPVTLIGRRAMIDAKFGAHDTRFIVDSGAFYSTVARASAIEFGMKLSPAPSWFHLRGVNGDATAMIGKTKDFSLAGITLPPVEFLVGGSDTGTAGLLGHNILGLADVEYDLPHGTVRLMKSTGCNAEASLAYWATNKPFSQIALEKGDGSLFKPHTIGTVLVNGVKMRATFDSGAQTTVMTLSAAKKLGITPTSPGVTPLGSSTGIGSKQINTWLATFDKIDIGGEMVPTPKFHISALQIDTDMLIGFDFFLTHRIFVSNTTHQLYLTYEGGSVFGLTPSGAKTATGEKLDLTDTAAEPTTAEGYSRRGAVLMSNRKYAEGLADLDKAVAMAPGEGRYLLLRAQAHMANGQILLAAADFDKAATLMPDNPEVHLARARLRLINRDPEGATEDVKAADRVLAANSDQRLQLAGLYDSLDQHEAAITNYDAWLKMHGEDAGRATAYNGRCWSRALLNQELSRALSDCNMALHLRPNYGPYLDSRALVYLRTGKLDEAMADYEAAIKTMPRNAWMLYAKSITEKKLGKTDAAETDRKAALAINSGVAKRAAKFGLAD